MKFTKAPPELVATFDRAMPGPPAEKRKMFGYPAAFVNRNMFMGIFGDRMFVRLGEDEAAQLLKLAGAKPLEPMPGRVMRGYVVLPGEMLRQGPELARWVKKSVAYAQSLPAKTEGCAKKPAQRKSR